MDRKLIERSLRERWGRGRRGGAWAAFSTELRRELILAESARVLLAQFGEQFDAGKDALRSTLALASGLEE